MRGTESNAGEGTRRPRLVSRFWKPLGVVALVLIVINVAGFDPIGSIRDRLFGVEQRPEAAGTTLLSIQRTAELRAATGEFSVPVYFGTEQDGVVHEVLPDAIDGNSGVAIYQGSVDAFVDLKGLTTDDLDINRSERSIVITVPAPRLSDPNVDEAKSKVITQNRGLATRLGELFGDTPLEGRDALDDVAVDTIRDAADESELRETAKENTIDFLTSLAQRLGYDTVEVRFEEDTTS